MDAQLDERKVTILKPIIKTYLETGEPVGSRTISKYSELKLSSATIRNEMSDLEEMGYIIQPHTSAGRIPSDKGYRFYVDQIMQEKENEVTEFKDVMVQKVDKLELVLKKMAQALAANTNYAAMISGPSYHKTKLKFIQLSRVEANKLLVVVVVEGNIIKNTMIDIGEDLGEQELLNLNILLNSSLNGLTIEEINLGIISKLKEDAGIHSKVIELVLNEVAEAIKAGGEDLQIYTSGATNIFKYPELAENLSTCRSPQQMFGAVVREYYKDPEKNEGKRLVSVSIMPCTAKKEEILRPESMTNGKQDVDYVLTTTEIIRMIKKSGIVFDKVEIEAADVPFGIGSGSGVIFGVTGGVTEAVLRRLQQGHNRVDMEAIKTSGVRGDEGIKELTYNYNGREIKAAVVSGLANADKVIERIKNNEVHYDFVEVMACRRGCIMGGGQPVNAGPRTKRARMKGLYDTDVNTQIKKSNENPMILSLYDSLLKGKEHELLHRNFTK